MSKTTEAITLVICAVLLITISICSMVSAENREICQHKNYVFASDKDEHWKECTECEEEIPNSRKKHLFSYGHCDCEAYVQ